MEDMNIQELVSVLRTAFMTKDFDRVEKVLVSKYNRLQTEIIDLQEKLELEKLTRFQAEEDCERHKNNYETLMKEVKKKTILTERDNTGELRKLKEKWMDDSNTLAEPPMKRSKDAAQGASSSSSERNNIGELRKKNSELDLEVCELRKLREKWVDDSNALAELRIRVCVLEKKNSEDEKSTKTNSEALAVPMITDFEDRDEENVAEHEIDNDIVEPNPLQSNEPPSKKSKKDQGASSAMTQTRGATVDAAHSRHGNPITSFCTECVARHAPIVEEPQQNANVHMSKEVVVMGSVVVPPSDVQEQMAIHFISLVHQERYSNFLANKKFVEEKNLRFEGEKYSDIHSMIMARGWVELTSFAKDASIRLAKEFFANAYQDPAKDDGNNNNDLKKFTSFVRGKEVPFHDKIINELFGLENYEQCSFEARKAKGSIIDHQEIRSTLCRDKADWVRNKDGTPSKLRTSDLTPNAKAWAIFVLRTLLPCSNTSDLTIQKASLVTAILKGERVNVGRLLADDLWGTANCSNPSSYISHASLISKLCERVEVYPEKNEEMVKPSGAITAKWIEKHCTGDIVKNRSNCI